MYAIAKKGLNAYETHETNKWQQPVGQPVQTSATQSAATYQNRETYPTSSTGSQTYQQSRHLEDQTRAPPTYQASDMVHKAYCNGQCQGQCGGAVSQSQEQVRKA